MRELGQLAYVWISGVDLETDAISFSLLQKKMVDEAIYECNSENRFMNKDHMYLLQSNYNLSVSVYS